MSQFEDACHGASTGVEECPDCGWLWAIDAEHRCPGCGMDADDLYTAAEFLDDLFDFPADDYYLDDWCEYDPNP